MKPLFVCNFFPPHHVGGYEVAAAAVADGLAERGHEVAVLTSRRRREGIADSDASLPYPVSRSLIHCFSSDTLGQRVRSHWAMLRNSKLLSCEVASRKPDILFLWAMTNLTTSPLLAIRQLSQQGLPVAIHAQDLWPRDLLEKIERLPRWAKFLPEWRKLAAGAASWLKNIPVSPLSAFAGRELAKAGFTQVADPIFSAVPPTLLAGKAEIFARKPGGKNLLFCGRLVENKGVATALKALALMKTTDATLDIVGEGRDRQSFEALARELGLESRVRFLGRQESAALPALYDAAALLLVPSHWEEPFGLVAVEAMARGTAVIASKRGGLPEIVADNETGLVLPPEDAPAWAEAIDNLLASPTKVRAWGLAGRDRAERLFLTPTQAEKQEAFLMQTIAQSKD